SARHADAGRHATDRGRSGRYHSVGLGHQWRVLGRWRHTRRVYRNELGILRDAAERGRRLHAGGNDAVEIMTALIDLVRGATFDDFLFNPQYSVVDGADPF